MARPALATPQAADGLRLDGPLRAMVCGDTSHMVARLTRLLTEGDTEGLGIHGRDWVLRHYSWTTNLARIRQLLENEPYSLRSTAVAGEA